MQKTRATKADMWKDRGSKMVSNETTEAENKRSKHETNLEGRNDGIRQREKGRNNKYE